MNKSNRTKSIISTNLEAQRKYTEQMTKMGFMYDLVIADAFIRGIRDLGYKSTATAIDELIDNPIQAEAKNVHIIFGFMDSNSKPHQIAVIDDGHGMDPDMMRLSVIWGGTHRENDRTGMGRYGYGLPSATVSQGRCFSVYSIVEGGEWHRVTVDVDEISDGKYTKDGRILVPESVLDEVPEWISKYISKRLPDGLSHGTVVVIEKLDKLTWKTANALERHLLQHFGITYRNFLREVKLFVQSKEVEPIDPLFTTPGFRFYDLDEDRAEALDPLMIDVKDEQTRKDIGTIKVRFAYMPPTFQQTKESKEKAKAGADRRGGKMNARFQIMKEHNGIIVLRQGRQIDVVTRCPWMTFRNYDRNWGVEVDFSAALDEEFSITTSKQQVVLSDRIWDILKEHGISQAIREMRRRFSKDVAKVDTLRERDPEKKRVSEQTMEESQKFKTRRPAGDTIERKRKAQEALEKEIERRSELSGIPPQEVERQLVAEIQGHPYRVTEESLSPGGPFFDVKQWGSQKVLRLNTDHRFFTNVYAGPESTPRLRAALEVLLWVLGECKLDSSDERELFYETERGEWSRRLNSTLAKLDEISSTEDAIEGAVDEEEGVGAEVATT